MSFRKILAFVFGAHLIIAFALCIHHVFSKPPIKKKIVVHTYKRPEPPKKVISKTEPTPAKKKVVAKPKPKKPPEKKVQAKKAEPKTPSSRIEKKVEVKKPEPITSAPKTVAVEQEQTPPKEDPLVLEYGGILISFFQENLDLPDFGEVMMKVEIDIAGKITSSEVLKAESSANEEFLKNRLPELVCPCFNGNLNDRNSFEFTIVFKNR